MNYKVGDLREPLSDEQITTGRTWDVQLALALLDATAGTGLAGAALFRFFAQRSDDDLMCQVLKCRYDYACAAGDLWDQYTMELPSPEHMTLPFCYSPEVLDQIQCAAMKSNALKQQMRLKKVSPEVFSDHLSHRVTTGKKSNDRDILRGYI